MSSSSSSSNNVSESNAPKENVSRRFRKRKNDDKDSEYLMEQHKRHRKETFILVDYMEKFYEIIDYRDYRKGKISTEKYQSEISKLVNLKENNKTISLRVEKAEKENKLNIAGLEEFKREFNHRALIINKLKKQNKIEEKQLKKMKLILDKKSKIDSKNKISTIDDRVERANIAHAIANAQKEQGNNTDVITKASKADEDLNLDLNLNEDDKSNIEYIDYQDYEMYDCIADFADHDFGIDLIY